MTAQTSTIDSNTLVDRMVMFYLSMASESFWTVSQPIHESRLKAIYLDMFQVPIEQRKWLVRVFDGMNKQFYKTIALKEMS